ncbi:MAG: DUF433 domain-containing protein [Fimbriimonadaceae bacterium]|nr:DUF433 domain-containing protein [Fimbriimonadaceae bacterium]
MRAGGGEIQRHLGRSVAGDRNPNPGRAMSLEHIAPRAGERTVQMFFKGTRKRAWTVVALMRLQGMTVEEIAQDHGVSPEAVREAIEWCDANRELIEREERETARLASA